MSWPDLSVIFTREAGKDASSMPTPSLTTPSGQLEKILGDACAALAPNRKTRFARLLISSLSGIPWAGAVLAAGSAFWSEQEQGGANQLVAEWMALMVKEMARIAGVVAEVSAAIDADDASVNARASSEEYGRVVRDAFKSWSAGESEGRRNLVRNLLVHAAETMICPDDVVKLFARWIFQYDELHFRIVRTVYQNPGCTRGEIWRQMGGVDVAEDSAEADLFKTLVFDLSTGHVIRQDRQQAGPIGFARKMPRGAPRSGRVVSAFEDGKPYVLTALGKQFVLYTMSDIVPKIGSAGSFNNN